MHYTFTTSGPRIRIRFFAGADLAGIGLDDPDLVTQAYKRGIPMGGDLGATEDPPAFLVWAARETEARRSSNPCGGTRTSIPASAPSTMLGCWKTRPAGGPPGMR